MRPLARLWLDLARRTRSGSDPGNRGSLRHRSEGRLQCFGVGCFCASGAPPWASFIAPPVGSSSGSACRQQLA
uniref:Uncharacterized protein n=1 Tax=Kalanchoe fedtschenkoi TaxID=63787 RepID=A0A7N0TNK8_KALFE